MREIKRGHPTDYDSRSIIAMLPLRDHVVGKVSAALWILLSAVGMVLLMACANVAHLALARALNPHRRRRARGDVLRMVLRQGLALVATGVAVGFAASTLLTRFLTSMLFEVRPVDLVTALLVSVTILSLALLANYLPARKASRVDPLVALRCE